MITMGNIYPKAEYHILKTKKTSKEIREPLGNFYWNDVREGLDKIKDQYKEKIQLIYLDPPFMTGQSFSYRRRIGKKGLIDQVAYRDKWKEGKGQYLDFMRWVFEDVHEMLAPEGSLYLHVDYRTSAYLRVVLDEIFGEDNFLNEIIWHYQSGGRAKRHFSRKHDTILFYQKSNRHYFNPDAIGVPRGNEKRNNMKKGMDEDGRAYWSIKSGGKIYKYYEDSKVYPSDVWTDIPHLHQRNPERTGYGTQKPEALLERIILASSRPGDYVADFFAGSGTTLAVAQKLNRQWIGMDSSDHSIHVCRKRLLKQGEKEDFIIHYSDKKCLFEPEITIDLIKGFNANIKVTLLDYKPTKEMNNAYDNQDIQIKGIDQVDYWAVGYVKDRIFYPVANKIRDDGYQTIGGIIDINCPIEGDVVVHIVDLWGNQFFCRV